MKLTSPQKLSVHVAIAAFIVGSSLVATELQEGQSFSEHATDLLPLLVGIIVLLGGALITLITWQFVSLRNSMEEHARRQELQLAEISEEQREDTRRLSKRLDHLRERIIRIESKMGIENGTTQLEEDNS
jgi:hypothetical protein